MFRAREKYFSFYPMFAVLKGGEIDMPHQQQLIEEYREALGKLCLKFRNLEIRCYPYGDSRNRH